MPTKRVIDYRHPEWHAFHGLWAKYRLAYEGGRAFIEAFLKQYSKRELKSEYQIRKEITYNPGHAKAAINIVRNALMIKFTEIQRTGDARYTDAMAKDVDLFATDMNAFMGLEVTPLLLAQGKRFVLVDAPPAVAGATLLEDSGRPYLAPVDAENVLSWSYDDGGSMRAVLLREWVDSLDRDTGLMDQALERYRYMLKLNAGDKFQVALTKGQSGNAVTANAFEFTGPGVVVRFIHADGKEAADPVLLPLTAIPLVEFRLVDALMTDIADMQIALLNLASSDMSFLFRGNFPIYTEQFDPARSWQKRPGSKRDAESSIEDVNLEDRITKDERPNNRLAGSGQGIGYAKDLDRPDFIAPPVSNLDASMKKQLEIRQEIRLMVDLALTSMSVKALEQSGKSKDADKVGEEAGLAYIANVLETGERQIATLWHEFLGAPNTKSDVQYPVGFSIQTPQERIDQAKGLKEIAGAARSETYAKTVQKRIVELVMKPLTSQTEMERAQAEVDDAPYFDEDKARAELVQKDVEAGLVSAETGTIMRGYGEEEVTKAAVDREITASLQAEQFNATANAFNRGTPPPAQGAGEGGGAPPPKPPAPPPKPAVAAAAD
jgi:hypothetical protein